MATIEVGYPWDWVKRSSDEECKFIRDLKRRIEEVRENPSAGLASLYYELGRAEERLLAAQERERRKVGKEIAIYGLRFTRTADGNVEVETPGPASQKISTILTKEEWDEAYAGWMFSPFAIREVAGGLTDAHMGLAEAGELGGDRGDSGADARARADASAGLCARTPAEEGPAGGGGDGKERGVR